jgi:hypothetical protein
MAGDLAVAVATVRAFADRAMAARVVVLLDRGDAVPAMLECAAGGDVVLTDGDERRAVRAEAAPHPLPELRPPPPSALQIDPDTGELEAPLGVVSNLARGVLALARVFGGRSVATADVPTRDPALALTIAAREGEPLVVAAGDHRFELPESAL